MSGRTGRWPWGRAEPSGLHLAGRGRASEKTAEVCLKPPRKALPASLKCLGNDDLHRDQEGGRIAEGEGGRLLQTPQRAKPAGNTQTAIATVVTQRDQVRSLQHPLTAALQIHRRYRLACEV